MPVAEHDLGVRADVDDEGQVRGVLRFLGQDDPGRVRADIDPIQLHMTISALCFFNVSNRYTFSKGFGVNIGAPQACKKRRAIVVETVLAWVRRPR